MDISLHSSDLGSLQLDPNLRSLRSPAAKLYIENGTERTVDIYWINYNSKLIRLSTLQVFILPILLKLITLNSFAFDSALQRYTDQHIRTASLDIHRSCHWTTVARQKPTRSVRQTIAFTKGKSFCAFSDEKSSGHNSSLPVGALKRC